MKQSIQKGKRNMKLYEDLNIAKIDTDRERRTGFKEVVFCQGKKDEFLLEIYKKLYELNGEVFGTRASKEQYELIKSAFSNAEYDDTSRILKISSSTPKTLIGNIAVCTAGTSDIPVAEECAQTAEYFGSFVQRHYDVGVAGIHRLMSNMDEINKANAVVAIWVVLVPLAAVGAVGVPVRAALENIVALLSLVTFPSPT